ncbi:MAG TPA: radical SAM protein [Candidatus Desulfofervidus auxilii]|uniref:Radical SAM protein n=1 Tax=Desulfofervidus auxilii TaxID=1621989 RepID=A0A7C0Y5S0_DESA2|nr:radical SAM protein [Candidatus Desulfofervidus auxilii]
MLKELPYLVYADDKGRIYNHPYLKVLGKSGEQIVIPEPKDFIPLPEGSKLFFLPKCPPLGYDEKRGHIYLIENLPFSKWKPCHGVAAFMSPGYLRTLLPAVDYSQKDYILPLWGYTAVGWYDGRYWVAGILVEDNPHWHPSQYDDRTLLPKLKEKIKQFPNNRLIKHLKICATEFHCFAAKNAFYKRWELPVPISPTCNARCLGCLSWQEGSCPPSHHRISFIPSVEEVIEFVLPHLLEAEEPIISFGQGCEGEPLLQGKLIEKVIKDLRKRTNRGTINLNTNGSLPEVVAKLADAGLDSIRISLNSAQDIFYQRYYRPLNYNFKDVKKTIKIAKEKGLFVMINYLTFPGLSDTREEIDALKRLIEETEIDLIQLKNLNIDPFLYCRKMDFPYTAGLGMKYLLKELKDNFPQLTFGYFNRFLH